MRTASLIRWISPGYRLKHEATYLHNCPLYHVVRHAAINPRLTAINEAIVDSFRCNFTTRHSPLVLSVRARVVLKNGVATWRTPISLSRWEPMTLLPIECETAPRLCERHDLHFAQSFNILCIGSIDNSLFRTISMLRYVNRFGILVLNRKTVVKLCSKPNIIIFYIMLCYKINEKKTIIVKKLEHLQTSKLRTTKKYYSSSTAMQYTIFFNLEFIKKVKLWPCI